MTLITYRIRTYSAAGELMREFVADVDEGDGAEFIAHQTLHADGVTAVQISDPVSDEVVLRRADPGLSFDEVVQP